MKIREVTPKDIPAITEIYNEYIENTCITFETETLSHEEMTQRMKEIIKHYPYRVCEEEGNVIGYCYAHRWKEKQAYSATAETTIYIRPSHCGKGIGQRLMKDLITACHKQGIHTLIACITVPNDISVRLHESLGFTRVSLFKEVGRKFGKWLDIYDFQLVLTEKKNE